MKRHMLRRFGPHPGARRQRRAAVQKGALVGLAHDLKGVGNPYLFLLRDALRDENVTWVYVPLRPVSVAIARWARGVRAVHLHWPEVLVPVRHESRVDNSLDVVRVAALILGLLTAKVLGVRIVWTIHNLRPHDPDHSWAAGIAYRLAIASADVCVTHSTAARHRVARELPALKCPVVVVPHGNYTGVYPATHRTREELRVELGVADTDLLLLAFGQVRAYKRLVELAHAVATSQLSGVKLLIAGKSVDAQVSRRLVDLQRESSGRILLALREVPDQEVAGLYRCADLAVINYGELFSSGALLLALSQHVAVVCRDSESAREVASWPALATYTDEDALGAVVARVAAVPTPERAAAAASAAARFGWPHIAKRTKMVYFGALPAVAP